jgi:hypothetical protein
MNLYRAAWDFHVSVTNIAVPVLGSMKPGHAVVGESRTYGDLSC